MMENVFGADENELPDSAFAYIEPGGQKDGGGRTTPRSLRHFRCNDEASTRNSLTHLVGSPFEEQARPKLIEAAKRYNLAIADDARKPTLERVPTERRYTAGPVECRAMPTGSRKIGGHAAVFYTAGHPSMSKNLGGFVERVMPSAFNQCRNGGWTGAICRYNHDMNMLLGTTAGRTLELGVDNVGLHYEVLPPQSRADILELVERGDVQHSSFAFRVPTGGDEWSLTEQNYPMRSLVDVQLVDVAPVVDPAYQDADAGLRSLADHVGVEFTEVRGMAQRDELRRFFIRTDRPSVRPAKPAPKRTLGAAAAAQLLERRFDPFVDGIDE